MYEKINFKNRINEIRTSHKIKQKDLAKLCGLSINALSDMEHQKYQPTAYNCALLCYYMDCTFEDMFYFEDFVSQKRVFLKKIK